ncbi:unnamed protein product [Effrenium voratum]|nr:unnamed protein product [Effrenium voratum]
MALRSCGVMSLGGDKVTEALVDHCCEELASKHGVDLRTSGRGRAMGRLRRECERVKRTLSHSLQSQVEVDEICEGLDFFCPMSRARLEELVRSRLQLVAPLLEQVLGELDKSDVHDVLLVGGAANTPKLRELVRDFFDKETIAGVRAEEAVVSGNAIQAAILCGVGQHNVLDLLLLDVSPLSIGFESANGAMTRVIARNTTIPTRKTVTLTTHRDNQPSVTIRIYEGEAAQCQDSRDKPATYAIKAGDGDGGRVGNPSIDFPLARLVHYLAAPMVFALRHGSRAFRALRGVSSAAAAESVFRILSPTAILGYGFPEESFEAAVASHSFDLIAVDAGSIDPGPYYLATRSSFTAAQAVRRDLRLMARGIRTEMRKTERHSEERCKLVVGSAGGCGTDNQVALLATLMREILAELEMEATIATITSEVTSQMLEGRQLTALGQMPAPELDGVVVAQMGVEPIMTALEKCDIVLCGRAYDPAVFAAEPLRRGFPAAAALHAAKVLECGAIAASPGSGSDCLAAELDRSGAARFWAPNKERTATPLSVAAHTLYEKSHPHCFGLPGGVLNTRRAKFRDVGDAVEVTGTRLARTKPTVKLEGAKLRGARTICIDLLAEDLETAGKAGFVYGVNGVEERPLAKGEEELGILIEVTGEDPPRKNCLALLRASLLHWGFPGRKTTAGNLAFPFSPSDLDFGKGLLTVCGTRDPDFIARWPQIQQDVQRYVASLQPFDGLSVRVISCGLPGLPRLQVVEGDDAEEASTGWRCRTEQADFTVHHLVEVDEELLAQMFPIQLHGDGSVQNLRPKLLPWGDEPEVTLKEAYGDWEASRLLPGQSLVNRRLGDMARVVRSKNAGINEITFDLIFEEESSYLAAKQSSALDAAKIQSRLQRQVLGVYCDDACLALKITCARGCLAGSKGDRDVYGAQQHRSLLDLIL